MDQQDAVNIHVYLEIAAMIRVKLSKQLSLCLFVGIFVAAQYASAQSYSSNVPPGRASARSDAAERPPTSPTFLSFAKFKIPFNIERQQAELSKVQLWVSTDEGLSWQMHGAANPADQFFDFNAAAEGLYFFSVQTVDHQGGVFPSQTPPLKVLVDTTKPEAAMRADTNAAGQLVVDVRLYDEHVDLQSAVLKMRTDRDQEWRTLPIEKFNIVSEVYQGRVAFDLPLCREIALVFAVNDLAKNVGEATFRYSVPRTASAEQDMTLASTTLPNQQNGTSITGAPSIPGAVAWEPAPRTQRAARTQQTDSRQQTAGPQQWSPAPQRSSALPTQQFHQSPSVSRAGPGQLANSREGRLLEPSQGPPGYDGIGAEELPPPRPSAGGYGMASRGLQVSKAQPTREEEPQLTQEDRSSSTNAYHCKSHAFSLDYAVEALGGSTLAKVELWGTDDGGRVWERWGEDADRQSPFDVMLENDGLFGFRMVIVGSNGVVSNRPADGDSADVWINIDTSEPTLKITRAVYGEGDEDGMLVIDYQCQDGHLVDRPITLSYSETVDGPWTLIASGQKNTGIYLWKADPNLPNRIYLKVEAIDKAGNIGMHRLDLPIDTKGLGPHGRIQGFRPILNPSSN